MDITSTPQSNRYPISCEPCRARKIRCPRDSSPCGTCVRRRVPPERCVYARRGRRSSRHAVQERRQSKYVTPASRDEPERRHDNQSPGTGTGTNADLVSRIEKLERALQQKDSSSFRPSPLQEPVIQDNTINDTPGPEPVTAFTPGTLLSSSSGHVRFLPMASSWGIIHGASTQASLPDQQSAITDTPNGPYPFGEHDAESRSHLLLRLPPTEYCDQLKDLYFQSISPIFPILHQPTFAERYSLFSENSDNQPLEWLALLFVILGTAVLALDRDSHILKTLSRKTTPWGRVTDLSERYYTAAMKCLEADHYLWRHNITTLQTLLILVYGIHHSHGQTWTLLGLAHHLAVSIGCHVDPSAFSLDIIDAEERRRSWAGLMMLLCNQNMSMTGFDLHRSAPSFRVQPPAEVWDENISRGQHEPSGEVVGLSHVAYLMRKYRLFQISSEICNTLLVTRPTNPTTLYRLDAAIRAEQDPLEQMVFSSMGPGTTIVHVNLLLSFSHHLVLLLHSTVLTELSHRRPHHSWSKERCMDSARRVLELHAEYHRSPEFRPFHWYIRGRGGFHAFHAAMVLILTLAVEGDGSYTRDVMQLLQECLARLEDSKEQSLVCSRAATILRPLISSKLLDSDTASRGLSSAPESEPILATSQLTNPNVTGFPVGSSDVLGNSSNDWDSRIPESVDFTGLLRQFQPQQWANPSNMDWGQWEMMMTSLENTH